MSSDSLRIDNDQTQEDNEVSRRYNTRSQTKLSTNNSTQNLEENGRKSLSTLRRISNSSIRSIYRRFSNADPAANEESEDETFDSCRSKLTVPGRDNRNPRRLRRESTLLDFENSLQDKMDDHECCENNAKKNRCFYLTILIALAAFIMICIPFVKIMATMHNEIMDIHQSVSMIKNKLGYPDDTHHHPKSAASGKLSEEVTSYVKTVLQNYDSDKTGKTDYALESIGGKVVKIIDTENYMGNLRFFGITLCEGRNGPSALIRASTDPGECWAFKGSKGTIQIKLLGKIKIDSISLEHISSNLSPTGKIDTAPKEFSIYGMETLTHSKVFLGKFEYEINKDPIQNFPIKNTNSYEFVEFQVHSNHGSPDYTCVYRLRVHGKLEGF